MSGFGQHGPSMDGSGYRGQPMGGPGYPSGPTYNGYPSGTFYAGGPAPAPDGSDRGVAVFAHLAAVIAAVVSAGSVAFLGPLIVWAIYKDKSPFVRQAAAGAFNFNLGMTVMSVAGWIMVATVILAPIGAGLIIVANITTLILSILGAVRASKGEPYRYPMQLRVLS